MQLVRFPIGAVLLTGALLTAQIPDVKSLSGKYFFRQLLIVADGSQASSLSGSISFDGNGAFTFQGQQLTGTNGPTTASGTGTYSVNPNGSFILSPDPLRTGTGLNGKIGMGALVASNTENGTSIFDLLIAIPAPTRNVTNSTLSGDYWVATLELPAGGVSKIRDGFFTATANSTGGFGDVAVSGEVAGSGYQSQTAPGSTYTLNSDGSGSANFPAPASANSDGLILTGTKTIAVSQDGSIFIGGGTTAGANGIIVGIQVGTTAATNSTLSGIYFGAGMSVSGTSIAAFAGAANVTPANTSIVWSRRYLQTGYTKPLNVSAVNSYSIASHGSGTMLEDRLAATSNGNFFIASGVEPFLNGNNFELIFGVKAPPSSGSGVFLDPLRVLNAASYAIGGPISEGEIITLFGSGFASQITVATKLPLTTTLGGVQVLINGTAVPIFSVTPTQVSAMVPYGISGATASVVVSNAGKLSNTVTVPVAATSPGIFTMTSDGLGSGAVLHADYSLVSSTNPARHGETVQVFLTGLGAVNPAVAAGTAAPTNPLSFVTGPVAVYISGLPATITYQGLAPSLTALYQLNFTIPMAASAGSVPLAIETADGFTDQANIVIGPN